MYENILQKKVKTEIISGEVINNEIKSGY